MQTNFHQNDKEAIMKDFRLPMRIISLAVICIVVLVSGCSSDKKEEPSADISTPQKTEEQKPGKETTEMNSEGMMTIYAELFTTHTKGPVIFPHDKHNKEFKIACNECHHIYENGKNVWNEDIKPDKCEKCHNEPTVKKEKSLPPDLQKKNLKLAFHNKCLACHRKRKAENPELKSPTTCSGCHKKME